MMAVCVFAGGFKYLHVKKPGLDVPLVEQMGQADFVSHPRVWARITLGQGVVSMINYKLILSCVLLFYTYYK